jgi:hypothetical protein
MGQSTKPRKRYRPKGPSDLRTGAQPWRLEMAFGIIDELMQHLARAGTLDATEEGTLLYRAKKDGRVYEAPLIVNAYAEIFEIARSRDLACPEPLPLRHLARQLRAGETDVQCVQAAIDCLASLRVYVARQPLSDIMDVATTAEIKFRLDGSDDDAFNTVL